MQIGQVSQGTCMQRVYDSIMYLRQEIIKKEPPKMEEIGKAMGELISGIDLVSSGTPV